MDDLGWRPFSCELLLAGCDIFAMVLSMKRSLACQRRLVEDSAEGTATFMGMMD